MHALGRKPTLCLHNVLSLYHTMSDKKLGAEVGELIGGSVGGEKGKQVGRVLGAGAQTMLEEIVTSNDSG